MYPVDFFVGSDLGSWFVEHGSFREGDRVFSEDASIQRNIEKLNLRSVGSPEPQRAFSIHWPRKIDDSLIGKYEYFLNIHPGYLPLGRGTYPIFWAIFRNETAGVTIHQITNKMDYGPILFREAVSFGEDSTAGDLWITIRELEKRLLIEAIRVLRSYEVVPMQSIDSSVVGPNRKRRDFEKLRDNPDLGSMTDEEIYRLKLALNHPRFKPPRWAEEKKRS